MKLNDAAHKTVRSNTLRILGLIDLGDRMIDAAARSYASGKKATPHLFVRLPRRWRKMVGKTIEAEDIKSMIEEALAGDPRLTTVQVRTQYTTPLGLYPAVGRVIGFTMWADDLKD